jgi:hypothetical protein
MRIFFKSLGLIQYFLFFEVFRIHDILVWILIWIRGSMPLSYGSESGFGSCYFRHGPSSSRCQQKTNLKKDFLLTFWRRIYIIFKDKKSKSSRNHGFSYNFGLVMEGSGAGSGSLPLTNVRIQEAQNMWIRWIRIRIATRLFCIVKDVSPCMQGGLTLSMHRLIQTIRRHFRTTRRREPKQHLPSRRCILMMRVSVVAAYNRITHILS